MFTCPMQSRGERVAREADAQDWSQLVEELSKKVLGVRAVRSAGVEIGISGPARVCRMKTARGRVSGDSVFHEHGSVELMKMGWENRVHEDSCIVACTEERACGGALQFLTGKENVVTCYCR